MRGQQVFELAQSLDPLRFPPSVRCSSCRAWAKWEVRRTGEGLRPWMRYYCPRHLPEGGDNDE